MSRILEADKIKDAAPNQENAPSKVQQKQDTKESTILTILMAGNSLHRFTAEKLGDHTLPSTISTLRAKGYLFNDEWVSVPNRFGGETRVKLYSYIGLQSTAVEQSLNTLADHG